MAISPKGVAPSVVFRDAHFEDYEAIASVQSRNGLAAKPLEEWKHLWIENPVYKQLTHWHDGWVAENEDGKIVGYVGHVPLSYEFSGRQIIAACAHGLNIDASHRGYGVHLLKRHLGDKYTDVVLTSTANPNSGPTLRRSMFSSADRKLERERVSGSPTMKGSWQALCRVKAGRSRYLCQCRRPWRSEAG